MSVEFWVGPPSAPDTFRLVSMLGGGGEGEVWKAVLPLSAGGRRTVAVKVMPSSGRPEEPARWDRFGHLLRSLSHPGLVRVTDVFAGPGMHPAGAHGDGRWLYVVMDHVEGPSLRDWVVDHPDTRVAERLRMLRMIASALDEMHSGRTTEIAVAHGDVKPANIVVGEDRGTVLVDLGLARLADGAGVSGHSAPYAAPELRTPGALPTPATDRYAFAVTVAQTLTGLTPPLDAHGWLDLAALDRLLRNHPVTARRHRLVQQILDVLAAPPHARPPELRRWIDAAVESLSQLTNESDPRSVALQSAGHVVPQAVGAGGRTGPTATHGAVEQYPPAGAGPSVPAAGGATPPEGPGTGKRGKPRRRGRTVLVAALAVVVLGGGAAAVEGLYRASPHGSGTPAAAGPGTGGAVGSTPADLPTVVPATETQFLSDHDPVERDHADGTYTLDSSSVLNGSRYGHTIVSSVGCFNSDGGDFWIDYATDRQWSSFRTTAGLSDGSASATRGTWTVLGDGRPLADGRLALGDAAKVDVPVRGVLRLRLKIHDDGVRGGGCVTGHKAEMVWGDPTLTR